MTERPPQTTESGNEKNEVISRVEAMLRERGFDIVDRDLEKPWGGYFVLSEDQREKFLDEFFPEKKDELEASGEKLSPKILVVGPHLRLSWQYHDRRAELHKVLEGPVAYPLSKTDDQPEAVEYQAGELVEIDQGVRHRLVGLDTWGIVAEIWKHTDPANPSTEEDNHRVQDDFKRV